MTAQEALHEISTMVFRNTDNFEMRISKDCYKNIVKALEKQIPIKPLEENRYYGIGKCPTCGAVFLDKTTKYCGSCGQSLDWNDHPTEKGGVQE